MTVEDVWARLPTNALLTTEEARWDCAEAAAKELELRIRIEMVKEMARRGEKLPEAVGDPEELVTTCEESVRKLTAFRKGKLLEQLTITMANVGVDIDDGKTSRSREKKEERERRKAEGMCVACPEGNVKPALPNKTMCAECAKAQAERNARSRKRAMARKAPIEDDAMAEHAKDEDGPEVVAVADPAAGQRATTTEKGAERGRETTHEQRMSERTQLPFLKRGR